MIFILFFCLKAFYSEYFYLSIIQKKAAELNFKLPEMFRSREEKKKKEKEIKAEEKGKEERKKLKEKEKKWRKN
jgi:predicted Holliday junction resolvase-like endonuclease